MVLKRCLSVGGFGRFFKEIALCGLFLLITLPAHASTIQMLRQAKQGHWGRAATTAQNDTDRLTGPLYEWLAITKGRSTGDFAQIDSFLREYPNWPLKGTIELEAERIMPEDLPDAVLIAWFKNRTPQTYDGMVRYAAALVKARDIPTLKTKLKIWWPEADLTDSQQREFNRRFGHGLTKNSHIKRMNRLIQKSQYTRARAVSRFIGKGYPALANARITLSAQKKNPNATIDRVPKHLQDDPGLLYERLRWRRRNDLDYGAIEILHRSPPADKLPDAKAWWQERHILIRRLIEKKQYKSAYLLAAAHKQKEGLGLAQAEFLAGWLALRFLNEPVKAFEHFEKLHLKTKTPISRSRAAYWAGRASDALRAPGIARQWYEEAAQHQTAFYGQLARASLPDEWKPPVQTQPAVSVADKRIFEDDLRVQAAKALYKAGFRKEAGQFLQTLANMDQPPAQVRLAAELATRLKRHHDALKISKRAGRRGILLPAQGYPTLLSHMRPVKKTEWAFTHAIIRQESLFDTKAVSRSGAQGLMQLMPPTAREVAGKQRLPYSHSRLTNDMQYNIILGSAYLAEMVERFDGSYALAAAAYNGGPGRVEGWLKEFGDPRTGEIDLLDWMELIPVYETRNYVQRVLENLHVYRDKLDGVQDSARFAMCGGGASVERVVC